MATAFNLEVQDLPDGWTPLECVVVLTCLDEDGNERAVLRSTDLQGWQLVGLLRMAEMQTHTNAAAQWEDE